MPKELEKLRELFYKEWLNKPFTYEEFADWWLERIPKLFQERDKLLVEFIDKEKLLEVTAGSECTLMWKQRINAKLKKIQDFINNIEQ